MKTQLRIVAHTQILKQIPQRGNRDHLETELLPDILHSRRGRSGPVVTGPFLAAQPDSPPPGLGASRRGHGPPRPHPGTPGDRRPDTHNPAPRPGAAPCCAGRITRAAVCGGAVAHPGGRWRGGFSCTRTWR